MEPLIIFIITMFIFISFKKDADRESLYKKNHPNMEDNEMEKEEDDIPVSLKHPNSSFLFD